MYIFKTRVLISLTWSVIEWISSTTTTLSSWSTKSTLLLFLSWIRSICLFQLISLSQEKLDGLLMCLFSITEITAFRKRQFRDFNVFLLCPISNIFCKVTRLEFVSYTLFRICKRMGNSPCVRKWTSLFCLCLKVLLLRCLCNLCKQVIHSFPLLR